MPDFLKGRRLNDYQDFYGLQQLHKARSAALVPANNLSDITDVPTALENLSIIDSTNFSMTIGIGAGAAFTSTALNNIAFGGDALNDATTVDGCIAIGNNALSKVTTNATQQIAIGTDALAACTTGVWNSAIGHEVLKACVSGGYNTGIGVQALLDNTGSRNLALGAWALYDNVDGSDNAAVGYAACFKQTTGVSFNCAFGSKALFENLAGQYNCAIGTEALAACLGDGNVGIGIKAGDNITTADRCIVMGYFLDTPDATTDYQMTIGNLIYGTDVDGVSTTVASGRIGIAEAAPDAKLHVNQRASAGAIPVLKLEQLDVSEEMMELTCTEAVGNGIEGVGAKTLTVTEYIKVTVNGATRYIACGTIA